VRIGLRRWAPILLIAAACSTVLGSARDEIRIDLQRDAKRNRIYRLVNAGSRPILVRVEHRESCPELSGDREPEKRDYLVRPDRPIELRRVWVDSTCAHEFSILAAAYAAQPR